MPSYIRQIIGAAVGIIAALLFLMLGFWKGLLVIALGLLGWWLAGERKIPECISGLTDKIKKDDQNQNM